MSKILFDSTRDHIQKKISTFYFYHIQINNYTNDICIQINNYTNDICILVRESEDE